MWPCLLIMDNCTVIADYSAMLKFRQVFSHGRHATYFSLHDGQKASKKQ
jgi:hypothetical protein